MEQIGRKLIRSKHGYKSFLGSAGTQTAALAFGGIGPYPSPTYVADSRNLEWNQLD